MVAWLHFASTAPAWQVHGWICGPENTGPPIGGVLHRQARRSAAGPRRERVRAHPQAGDEAEHPAAGEAVEGAGDVPAVGVDGRRPGSRRDDDLHQRIAAGHEIGAVRQHADLRCGAAGAATPLQPGTHSPRAATWPGTGRGIGFVACITGDGFPRGARRQPGRIPACQEPAVRCPAVSTAHGLIRRSPGGRRRRAGPRRARRGVRRHRHEPALRVPRGVRAPGPAPSSRRTRSGVASIAFWALIIIISIKYLALVMRADNHGEGGILALTALVMPSAASGRRRRRRWCCSACSAPRCSTATGSSPRPSRCSARSRASRSRRRRSRPG